MEIREPLVSTIPVLTEAFHMLSPESHGSNRLRDFVVKRGLSIWCLSTTALQKAFEPKQLLSAIDMALV